MYSRFLTPSVAILFLGCTVNVDDEVVADEHQETRSVGTYRSVTNRSDADVELVENQDGDGLDAGDVLIVCEGGLVADVTTSLDSSGNLVIEMASEVATILGCTVTVVTDGVEEVVNDGDGNVVCEDTLPDVRTISVGGNGSMSLGTVEADELNIQVSGNGALTIANVQVTTLVIEQTGGGDATLAGDAVNCDLTISGNGDLRAQELTVADTLDALLNGTGNAVITVLGTVNAEVHGDASLEVYGGAEPGEMNEVDGGEVIFH